MCFPQNIKMMADLSEGGKKKKEKKKNSDTKAIPRRAKMYLTFLPTTQLQTSPSDVGDIEHEPVTRQRRLLPGDALCGSFSSRWREPRESKYLFMQGCSMLSLARRGSDWNDLLVSPPTAPLRFQMESDVILHHFASVERPMLHFRAIFTSTWMKHLH